MIDQYDQDHRIRRANWIAFDLWMRNYDLMAIDIALLRRYPIAGYGGL